MSAKKLYSSWIRSIWIKFIKYYLDRKNLTLAYHSDLQSQNHLAVLRHDPNLRKLIGFFIYPGSQMDLYDSLSATSEEYFTLLEPEGLKSIFIKSLRKFTFKLFAAVKRLERYEYFIRTIADSGFHLARGSCAASWGFVLEDPRIRSVQFIVPFYRLKKIEVTFVKPLSFEALINDGVSTLIFRLAMMRMRKFTQK
jgi:hypothetical protein